jgi:hypothetical protein
MLWYKSWLDTRWRFLIGLAILSVSACGIVFDYVYVANILPTVRISETGGVVGRAIQEAIETQRTYRGFVWYQWFHQNLAHLGTLFAALLGSGSLFAGSSRGALFTLSLPASRNRLLAVRATTGLAEFLFLAIVPSLAIPLLSPALGQHYSLVDTIVHGVCLFMAGAVFFSAAVLLSTVFTDVWRPLLISCGLAVVLALFEALVPDVPGIFHVMSAEAYFRTGALPWAGLLISAAAAAAMLYGSAINVARQDF